MKPEQMHALITVTVLTAFSVTVSATYTELLQLGNYTLFPSTSNSNSIEVDLIAGGTLDVIMLSDSSMQSLEYEVILESETDKFDSYAVKILKKGEQEDYEPLPIEFATDRNTFSIIWHVTDAFNIVLAARLNDTGSFKNLLLWTDGSYDTPVIRYLGIHAPKPAFSNPVSAVDNKTSSSSPQLNATDNSKEARNNSSGMESSSIPTVLPTTPAPLLWIVKTGPKIPYNCKDYGTCTNSTISEVPAARSFNEDDHTTPSKTMTNKNSPKQNRKTAAAQITTPATESEVDYVQFLEEDSKPSKKIPTTTSAMKVTSKKKLKRTTRPTTNNEGKISTETYDSDELYVHSAFSGKSSEELGYMKLSTRPTTNNEGKISTETSDSEELYVHSAFSGKSSEELGYEDNVGKRKAEHTKNKKKKYTKDSKTSTKIPTTTSAMKVTSKKKLRRTTRPASTETSKPGHVYDIWSFLDSSSDESVYENTAGKRKEKHMNSKKDDEEEYYE